MGLNTIRCAISTDFFTAFADIPKNEQKKVSEFITKFQNNPSSSGINYEKIHNSADDNMKSVRIDRDYRGIVYKPDKGNVYLLLWVDSHDRAYEWAERKKCAVNKKTGTVQVYEAGEEEKRDHGEVKHLDERRGIFSDISKNNLLRLGIPGELVNTVWELKDELEFEKKKNLFPPESYEALQFIKAGLSVGEVINELFSEEDPEGIEENDFEQALNNPGSKQQFIVVDSENEKELREILGAPLDKWRVFLHRSQRKIVERDYSGPVRILGGAGTGKTVVAMHRAKRLAEKVFNRPSDRILFTTFTVNLAADIKNNLRKICDSDVLKRIEVVNIDRWVNEYLMAMGYTYDLKYGKAIDDCWERACAFAQEDTSYDVAFFKDEWEQVIAPKDIKTLEEYLRCSRRGRGTPAGRKERKRIWQVIEEFKHEMNNEGIRDIHSMIMDARVVLRNKGAPKDYRTVVVDEAQDISPQGFKLLREMMGEEKRNDLFITGDAHQRIYNQRVNLKQCGINIRGRSRILRVNYRTTEETRNWAFSVLKGERFDDLNGGVDSGKGYKSLFKGPEPDIETFATQDEEVDYIANYVKDLTKPDEKGKLKAASRNICICVRTNKLLKAYKTLLRQRGLETYKISTSESENRTVEYLRIATMHRVKGLEFDYVIIAAVNQGTVPLTFIYKDEEDPVKRNQLEKSERSLLYVAATRAKKALLITSGGRASEFLSGE